MRLVSILIGLVAILPACSDAPDHPVDHGAPSKVYPAFALSVPQVVSLHHAVLENPEVRAVTFASDPLAPHAQDLVAHLADPAYWGATAQYGVGPLSAGAPIVVAEPAPDRADVSQVEAWLTEKLDGAHPEFGLPDAKTIYVVVYPASTMVAYEDSKRWCGAYHYGVTIGQTMVNYAVIADCASPPSDAEFVPLDSAISHEVVEAATDPLGASGFGGYTVDGDHLAWDYLYTPSPLALSSGREVGDLCEGSTDGFALPNALFYVQRFWSNAAMHAGHDPCVPSLADTPYMNVMPVLNDDIDFAADSKTTVRTKGVSIPQGGSRRVELDLYSDADTGGPWTVAFFALDLDSPQAFPQSAPHLRLTLDRHSGQNGEKLYLTIQRATTSALGTVVFIESFLGTGSSEWPIAVF